MKISRLLEQHQKFADQGLVTSFGDGYLVQHNRFYRSIRQAALGYGFTFSNQRNEFYEAFPLLQLEELLEDRTLPYVNNVSVFTKLSKSQLEALTWDDLEGNLKKNYVFHEASHAVVRALAVQHFGTPSGPGTSLDSQRDYVLGMLLEESCANACELLGVAEASDSIHRMFYEMNSYVCEFESRSYLHKALDEWGVGPVSKFLVLAYLHANFLREQFEDHDMSQMLSLSGLKNLDSRQIKSLRALAKVVFNLSERFRYQTTSFHLRLAGVSTPLEDLVDFPFMEALKRKAHLESFLNDWAALF
ncbi:hypothetical protein EZJ49_07350 [Bdellovibrio bacteriovorus]|uniref:hypothetical protein n=1 Tax=Bdellovibrio bacteriovorus TaxID=959 RepID=UPI0021CDFB75|nr:hypothetical protein [Bdellovibrio bacteriovorus]UXR66063.1 hypothetical protein EZJ49_07350 [Bdellovibrio bacteriovorus]